MDDVNILAIKPLLPPACLIEELPVSAGLAQTIRSTRKKVAHSVDGTSDKLVVIVGPCSIHNVKQAIEYVSTNTTDVRLACKHIRMHRAQIAEIALRSGCSRCSTAYNVLATRCSIFHIILSTFSHTCTTPHPIPSLISSFARAGIVRHSIITRLDCWLGFKRSLTRTWFSSCVYVTTAVTPCAD